MRISVKVTRSQWEQDEDGETDTLDIVRRALRREHNFRGQFFLWPVRQEGWSEDGSFSYYEATITGRARSYGGSSVLGSARITVDNNS